MLAADGALETERLDGFEAAVELGVQDDPIEEDDESDSARLSMAEHRGRSGSEFSSQSYAPPQKTVISAKSHTATSRAPAPASDSAVGSHLTEPE